MKKIEKQIDPKMMNLLQWKFNVENILVLINLHQDFKMMKNVAWKAMDVLLKKIHPLLFKQHFSPF